MSMNGKKKSRSTCWVQVLLLYVSVALIQSCSGSKVDEKPLPSLIIKEISFSRGGGFAGRYQGYVIDSTGAVRMWEGRMRDGAETRDLGSLTTDEIDSLKVLISESGILSTMFKQPGNMSTSIALSTSEGDNAVTWKGGEPGEEVPIEIQTFYVRFMKIIKPFIQSSSN